VKIDETTTASDMAESMAHLVANARRSVDDAKTYDIWHRRIDQQLDAWEVLTALNLLA
jgi:hypothetical protein